MRIDLDQMCVYDKVAKYIIEAECREPLHIGTGNGENGEVLIHPEENRPFVQAAGIAGAFREFYQYDEALQTRLFGSPYRGSEEKGSRVFFTDGFLGESSVYTEIRPRLRIDRRTATGQSVRTKGSDRRSGQKFEIESVAAGSRFSFAVYLYQKEEKLEKELERGLKALQEGRIQLGGQKSNGCGYVSLHSVKKAVYNFYSAEDRKLWAGETKDTEEILPEILESGESGEERLCFELTGHTEGGILVKSIAVTEYGENVPDAVNIRNHQRAYILPASSVKGVLRSQIEKIAAYKNTVSAVSDLFGQEHGDSQEGRAGKIRCFDCVIGDEKANDQAPVQCRIHIDKFTGGVMYGGLFSEKPAYGKLTVRVELDGGCDRESGLVLMALRDLAIGIVPMGSGSSIGRGFLKGEKLTVKRGSRVLAVIDCENGRTEDGSQYMEQCLKALEQAGGGMRMDARQIADHLYMEKVDLNQAKTMVDRYDYVIAHMISQLRFGTPDQVDINWEELQELHAFDLKGELHVFEMQGELEAVKVEEEEGCTEFLEKSYLMRNQSILKVREYLAADDDGQATGVYTRPAAVVKEA